MILAPKTSLRTPGHQSKGILKEVTLNPKPCQTFGSFDSEDWIETSMRSHAASLEGRRSTRSARATRSTVATWSSGHQVRGLPLGF